MGQPIRFVSLGMFILDDLRLPGGKVITDCLGGSGAYSTLGARLVNPEAARIGALIMAGRDFPDEIRALVASWGVHVQLSTDGERLSTRGLLEYHDEAFGHKSFRYTTTPLQPAPADLTPSLLSAASFHMLYRPGVVIEEVENLLRLRAGIGCAQRPLLVWEPFPSFCTPVHLDAHVEACRVVDVFSPNHLELLGLCGKQLGAEFDPLLIESSADSLVAAIQATKAATIHFRSLVVRAGEHGCFVLSSTERFWLRPLFGPEESSRVVDATGGGNTFLGAFAAAFQEAGDLRDAATRATVAASFAIEQIGLPTYRADEDGKEYWNGDLVQARLERFQGG